MINRKPRKRATKHRTESSRKSYWIYGLHAVLAALQNSTRQHDRLIATHATISIIDKIHSPKPEPETLTSENITGLLPPGVVHQGMALLTTPLQAPVLKNILPKTAQKDAQPLLVLDQVMDPRNVGAILRSAAAFNAKAIIVPDRHAPKESGVMVKAASGAFEIVPMIRVPNLSQAIKQIATSGYWCIGLDNGAERTVKNAIIESPIALILGGEGKGLRRLTRERCDDIAQIPIAAAIPSLNVSTSAAIALYEINTRFQTRE